MGGDGRAKPKAPVSLHTIYRREGEGQVDERERGTAPAATLRRRTESRSRPSGVVLGVFDPARERWASTASRDNCWR
jgi:hypothetical protein